MVLGGTCRRKQVSKRLTERDLTGLLIGRRIYECMRGTGLHLSPPYPISLLIRRLSNIPYFNPLFFAAGKALTQVSRRMSGENPIHFLFVGLCCRQIILTPTNLSYTSRFSPPTRLRRTTVTLFLDIMSTTPKNGVDSQETFSARYESTFANILDDLDAKVSIARMQNATTELRTCALEEICNYLSCLVFST